MTDIGTATLLNTGDELRIAKVLPGGYFVSNQPTTLVTVLGSCVSVCMRDHASGISGMNHFMLPIGCEKRALAWAGGSATRFGNVAMETMLKAMFSLGATKHFMEAKVFGGGRVLDVKQDVGAANIRFVVNYLNDMDLSISAQDVGKDYARKVEFSTATGRVRMKRIDRIYDGFIAKTEKILFESPDPIVASSLEDT